jgi:hypothetical protein
MAEFLRQLTNIDFHGHHFTVPHQTSGVCDVKLFSTIFDGKKGRNGRKSALEMGDLRGL